MAYERKTTDMFRVTVKASNGQTYTTEVSVDGFGHVGKLYARRTARKLLASVDSELTFEIEDVTFEKYRYNKEDLEIPSFEY